MIRLIDLVALCWFGWLLLHLFTLWEYGQTRPAHASRWWLRAKRHPAVLYPGLIAAGVLAYKAATGESVAARLVLLLLALVVGGMSAVALWRERETERPRSYFYVQALSLALWLLSVSLSLQL